MKLMYRIPNTSLQIPDPTKSHKEMYRLLEPHHKKDLQTFRASLPLLEFEIIKELDFQEILNLENYKIQSLSLDTPIDEIIKNTKILFGKNKVKKITKHQS